MKVCEAVTTGNLSIGATIKSSLTDSISIIYAQKHAYAVLGICTLAITVTLLVLQPHTHSPGVYALGYNFALLIVRYFAIAAAMRTWNPDFKMTPVILTVYLLVSLGAATLCWFAQLFLILPGIWLYVKLSLSGTSSLMGIPNPYQASWQLTKRAFWKTFGLIVTAVSICLIISFFIIVIASVLSGMRLQFGIAFNLLALAGAIWVEGFLQLVWIRWTLALQQYHTTEALNPTLNTYLN